jgi:nucleoside-diphosphate-sugar epimerase
MKILVTGNMGYVGPAVVKQLRESFPHATLIGLDAGYFANCTTNIDLLPECRLDHQIFSDVRDLTDESLYGVDAIVHLAAISNDPIGNLFEDVTLDINYKSSVALARRAKSLGVKSFVFASSCSMYGSASGDARKETDQLNPLTAYARSKVFTEKELEPLADENFIVTSLRFSTACGMSDRLRLDLVLNDFVACAITSGVITILSDGTPWRPLIDTKDMARAIDWALGRQKSAGGSFFAVNVGSEDRNYQVKDLAAVVANKVPGVKVDINQNAPEDKRSYRVDFSLYKSIAPDHQPVCTLEDSIDDLINGLQQMGFDNADFRSSHFMRLNHLKHLMAKNNLSNDLAWKIK